MTRRQLRPSDYASSKEAADFLGVSTDYITHLVQKEWLSAVWIGRTRLISWEVLRKYKETHPRVGQLRRAS